jgi:amino acid adenylation domain-containing protein
MNTTRKQEPADSERKDKIVEALLLLISNLLQSAPGKEDVNVSLLDMGANSLTQMEIIRSVKKRFGVKITLPQFFAELTTIQALADFIAINLPPDSTWTENREPVQIETIEPEIQDIQDRVSWPQEQFQETDSELGRIMAGQIQAVSQAVSQVVSHQLNFLKKQGYVSQGKSPAKRETVATAKEEKPATISASKSKSPAKSILPPWRIKETGSRQLSSRHQSHLDALTAHHTQRTGGSKKMTQRHRRHLADNRASAGFRLTTKEMAYPIIGSKAEGARFWDVDGNEYLDITMGFGVHYLGHTPAFVKDALEQQLKEGMPLGPQNPLAGEVATLISEMTGMDRVTFCSTGTEAVMTSLRLARAVTGRRKVVLFAGSYHGHFDGTLGSSEDPDDPIQVSPIAPGISPGAVSDIIVLEYGEAKSLEIIKQYQNQIAAVLVEPVQSRRPDLQPKEFLHGLRTLTKDAGIALIFDEIISGFRIHPGGAQAYFGVQADIATYGKIVGGGMPIGVVAGGSAFMDALDGGFWQYGDNSYPQADTTFFAGTFNKHPLTMAVAYAVLKYMKTEGEALQQRTNRMTTQLAERLNAYFKADNVPFSIAHFSSLFRFNLTGNTELLFYHLLNRGIYIWEGRNCFLSTAHTDEDIDYLVESVKESVAELRKGGFLPEASAHPVKEETGVEKTNRFPLTKAQKQLWVLSRMGKEWTLPYHIHISLELKGEIRLSAMQQAVQQVIDRHQALRCIIDKSGEFQEVQPLFEINIPLVDFSKYSKEEREGQVADFFKQESRKPFDLNGGSLTRVNIVKLEEQLHLLTMTIHHIAMDGMSSMIIINEVSAFYSSICQETAYSPDPAMQFSDYVQWRDRQRQSPEWAEDEAFWLEKLSGPIPVLNLPTDRPYPAVRSFQGDCQSRWFDTDMCANLNENAKTQVCTPFMLYFSAFAIWLHRLTGQNDVMVGFPTAGRNFEGSDRLVGYCTHVLPVRSHIEGNETFKEYLVTMRDVLSETYEHQDYSPFSELINKLNLQRDVSRSPLVSTIFNLDHLTDASDMYGLDVRLFSRSLDYVAWDIVFNLTESKGRILLECSYNRDIFDLATIQRYLGNFQTLLDNIIKSPESLACELPLLSDAEHHQLMVEWNDTAEDYPHYKTLIDIFAAQVDKTPDAGALLFEDQQLTYRELNTKADQLAYHLQSLGIQPEMMVGILMERSLYPIIGFLGILKAGGAYVPLDPSYPSERLTLMVEDAQIPLLLTESGSVNQLPNTSAQAVYMDTQIEKLPSPKEKSDNRARPENLAYVIYTSGSTGRPKGVLLGHHGLCNLAQTQIKDFGVEAKSRILQFPSLSFDASIVDIGISVCSGALLCIATSNAMLPGPNLTALLDKLEITHLTLPPSALPVLSVEEIHTPHLIVAGESCSVELAQLWSKGRRFFNAYGPTEGTVCATIYEKIDGTETSLPIGHPIANTQAYILDSRLQMLPVGVVGELHIGGVGIAKGYLNRVELTDKKFIPDPFSDVPNARLYKTGDLSKFRPDGNIEFLGRVDDQVKIRGFRIEPGEIEQQLCSHPDIENGVVISTQSPSNELTLAAYYVTHPEAALTSRDLKNYLENLFPSYMVPSYFVALQELPISPNGKVDRKALALSNFDEDRVSAELFVPPSLSEEKVLASIWTDILGIQNPGIHDNFFELGGHSLLLVRVHGKIEDHFGKSVTMTELFQYPTISTLSKRLRGDESQRPATERNNTEVPTQKDIAIIGMAGRFPGAKDIDTFWQNLCDGVESIHFFSNEELESEGIDRDLLDNPNYVKAIGYLEDIDQFDAAFFGYPPREAELMDPQQRLLHECAWQVFENAGYNVDQIAGKVGVYVGSGTNTYLINNLIPNRELQESIGVFKLMITNKVDFLPSRISYKLNLRGPSVNVQTACSTSLVAVHSAVQSLLRGECDMALAGGVTVSVPQKTGYLYQQDTIASPNGHCCALDFKALGTVDGSGIGVVLLKRLDLALRDRDNIHAVIKGSAINNDGAMKVGYTAPSVDGQVEVISEAMRDIDPNTITYIETHGTGTVLGDPIEIAALAQAYKGHTQKKGFCALGSVKTNVGHLDTAAGVTGLIKTVLAIKHKMLPPTLHFEQSNPQIDFTNSPFFVNNKLSEWKSNGAPRRAGVSSFGIGGTNAHIILEEAPEQLSAVRNLHLEKESTDHASHLILLSARTEAALEKTTANLIEYLTQHPDVNPADVAFTLSVGRKVFAHRRMLVCKSMGEATDTLRQLPSEQVFTQVQKSVTQPVVFMFSGQGSQYINMALGLYQGEKIFQQHIDHCAKILTPHLNLDLRKIIYPEPGETVTAATQLEQTAIAQPALFVIEYAMAQLLMTWGINPVAMVGHSIGEYVAACLAGVFSLEDALQLVALRGRLMQSMPSGAMLGIDLPETEVTELLHPGISLAAVNAPSRCVVSGNSDAIKDLEKKLKTQGIECLRLHTSHAFHSAMMEPILDPLAEHIKKITLAPPTKPYLSNLSGTWITAAEATNPEYWTKHLRSTVHFSQCVQTLLQTPENLLLEIGPGRTLATLVSRQIADKDELPPLCTLRHPKKNHADLPFLLNTLGRLWLAGVPIDWSQFHKGNQSQRLALPAYPFEKKRYWIDPLPTGVPIDGSVKKQNNIAEAVFVPTWSRSNAPVFHSGRTMAPARWLIFNDQSGLGRQLVEQLELAGQEVISIANGKAFNRLSEHSYTLDAQQPDQYETLFKELGLGDKLPETIVHLWSVSPDIQQPPDAHDHRAQAIGFHSLLFIVQRLQKIDRHNNFRIEVVSNQTQAVTGEESLSPEKANILGLAKVIPSEFPHIHCRIIDILLPNAGKEQKLAAQLLNEFSKQPPASLMPIAFRGPYRWQQSIAAHPLHEPGNSNIALKKNGVYLITQGLEGLGYLFAQHLAKTVQAKLVLVSPPGSLDSDGSTDIRGPVIAIDLEEEAKIMIQREAQLAAQLNIHTLNDFPNIQQWLDELCTLYVFEYISHHVYVGRSYRREDLIKQLKIIPFFERFFNVMLNILEEDGIVKIEAEQIEFLKVPESMGQSDQLRDKITKSCPELTNLIAFLDHCCSHYSEALSGEIKGISVIYPEGNTDMLKQIEKDTVNFTNQPIYAALLQETLTRAIQQAPNKKLRILEVGAGTGSLTETLLPILSRYNIEYHFTDLGNSFVQRGKRLFKQFDHLMQFNVLDISKDPSLQGYKNYGFDVILGLNVVHATQSISETLGHLKTLLAPRGLLCMIESVEQQRWVDLTWGLADGWWFFEDKELRTHSPLISVSQWEKVLKTQGFQSIKGFPQTEPERKKTDIALLMAQQPEELDNIPEVINAKKAIGLNLNGKITDLEAMGAQVMALNADATDIVQMQSVHKQATEGFGHISGVIHAPMIRDEHLINAATAGIIDKEFSFGMAEVRTLETLFKEESLDFMMLFSSHSGLGGGKGYLNQSTTETFFDLFAHTKSFDPERLTASIHWDKHQDTAKSFNSILAHELSQATVSKSDLVGLLNESQYLKPTSIDRAGDEGNKSSKQSDSVSERLFDRKKSIDDWFYKPVWKKSALPEGGVEEKAAIWLVFIDESSFSSSVVKKIKDKGHEVVTVSLGDEYVKSGELDYRLNPKERDGYHHLLKELRIIDKTPQKILHLWTLTIYQSLSKLDIIDEAQYLGFYSLLYITQALEAQSSMDSFQIEVVSNNIQPVTGKEILCPEQATILGAVKVIPLEYSKVSCRSIDITLQTSGSKNEMTLINQLWLELSTPPSEVSEIIAYRGPNRWVQTFEPVRLEKKPNEVTTRLREEGVYLITGGFGGMGFTLAEYLAHTLRAKLILVSRSKFPYRNEWEQWLDGHEEQDNVSLRIRKIQKMEKAGAEILVLRADISNREQMKDVIITAEKQLGAINGVFHGAGVIDYAGVIERRTSRELTDNVLAPKVKGTLVLDSLLKDTALDFFILCSSQGTILYQTKMGEVGYCAANDFLDIFSYYKRFSDNTFSVTINWNDWKEVGMAIKAAQHTTEKVSVLAKVKAEAPQQDALLPSEGIAAFVRILSNNTGPRVVVSTRELIPMIEEHKALFVQYLTQTSQEPASKATNSQAKPGQTDTEPRNPMEKVFNDIWKDLLGFERIGINDDFFEIGGDSLLATRFTAKVREIYHIGLPMQVMFERPTIAGIADYIERTLATAKKLTTYSNDIIVTRVEEEI